MSKHQEKISRLVSYWLRHRPEDGHIQLDPFGWAKVDAVLQALKTKGFDLSLDQLVALNKSFDKVRWNIDLATQKIKATHGHSIAIEQELIPRAPVATLYHGTASKNINGILENGLLKRQRQYVHLSETVEMALEVGKRHGTPCIIEIDTKQLVADGWEFFNTILTLKLCV